MTAEIKMNAVPTAVAAGHRTHAFSSDPRDSDCPGGLFWDVHSKAGDSVEAESLVDAATQFARLEDRDASPGIPSGIHRRSGDDGAESLSAYAFEGSDTEDAGET
jgi:hypothetical protein